MNMLRAISTLALSTLALSTTTLAFGLVTTPVSLRFNAQTAVGGDGNRQVGTRQIITLKNPDTSYLAVECIMCKVSSDPETGKEFFTPLGDADDSFLISPTQLVIEPSEPDITPNTQEVTVEWNRSIPADQQNYRLLLKQVSVPFDEDERESGIGAGVNPEIAFYMPITVVPDSGQAIVSLASADWVSTETNGDFLRIRLKNEGNLNGRIADCGLEVQTEQGPVTLTMDQLASPLMSSVPAKGERTYLIALPKGSAAADKAPAQVTVKTLKTRE